MNRATFRCTPADRGRRTDPVGFSSACRSGLSLALRFGACVSVIAVMAVVGAGCGDENNNSGMSRLSPRGVPYLDGVAVPSGFELKDSMGMDYESGGQRVAQHVYEGFADLHTVRNFYREQMPLLGWNRVTDQNVKGMISIRFEKPNEACTIILERKGILNLVRIQANVMPFNRKPSEPPPRRPLP